MQFNILSQQVGWFDGRDVCLLFKVKGSNLTNGVCVVNNDKLTEYFLKFVFHFHLKVTLFH